MDAGFHIFFPLIKDIIKVFIVSVLLEDQSSTTDSHLCSWRLLTKTCPQWWHEKIHLSVITPSRKIIWNRIFHYIIIVIDYFLYCTQQIVFFCYSACECNIVWFYFSLLIIIVIIIIIIIIMWHRTETWWSFLTVDNLLSF